MARIVSSQPREAAPTREATPQFALHHDSIATSEWRWEPRVPQLRRCLRRRCQQRQVLFPALLRAPKWLRQ
jgi:hypothetical protein